MFMLHEAFVGEALIKKKKENVWMDVVTHIIVPNFCNSSSYRCGAARP